MLKKYCLDMSGQGEFWPDKWPEIGQWPATNFQLCVVVVCSENEVIFGMLTVMNISRLPTP